MAVTRIIIEDLPEAMLSSLRAKDHGDSSSTHPQLSTNTSHEHSSVQSSLLASLRLNEDREELGSALAYDLWVKVALSVCAMVILMTLLMGVIQWRRQRGRVTYRVIPSDDMTRGRTGVPKTNNLLRNCKPSFSGVSVPLLEVSDV